MIDTLTGSTWLEKPPKPIGSRSTEVLDNPNDRNDRATPNGICEEQILGVHLSKLDADVPIPVLENTDI
jgi:hypothetical protein